MQDLNLKNLVSIARYGVVGVLTFILYMSVLFLCRDLLGFPYVPAVLVSYLVSVTAHFSLNRKVTFSSTSGNVKQQLLRYFVVTAINYLIQLFAIWLGFEKIGLPFYVAAFVASVIVMFSGYTLSRFWVFRSRS